MSSAINLNIARSRCPNGVADQRLRVALPVELLDLVKADADRNRRTVSSMAALIIAEHYAGISAEATDAIRAFRRKQSLADPAEPARL